MTELLCLIWSEMLMMTCVGGHWEGGLVAATNTPRQKKGFWKLLPKYVSCANVEGLEIRPSLAPILL